MLPRKTLNDLVGLVIGSKRNGLSTFALRHALTSRFGAYRRRAATAREAAAALLPGARVTVTLFTGAERDGLQAANKPVGVCIDAGQGSGGAQRGADQRNRRRSCARCAGADRASWFPKAAAVPQTAIDVGIDSTCTPVIADLNCDGKQDVALAHQAANSVSVLLGTGGGALAAIPHIRNCGRPEEAIPRGAALLTKGHLLLLQALGDQMLRAVGTAQVEGHAQQAQHGAQGAEATAAGQPHDQEQRHLKSVQEGDPRGALEEGDLLRAARPATQARLPALERAAGTWWRREAALGALGSLVLAQGPLPDPRHPLPFAMTKITDHKNHVARE